MRCTSNANPLIEMSLRVKRSNPTEVERDCQTLQARNGHVRGFNVFVLVNTFYEWGFLNRVPYGKTYF